MSLAKLKNSIKLGIREPEAGLLVLETLIPRTRFDRTPETPTRLTETLLLPPVSWLAASTVSANTADISLSPAHTSSACSPNNTVRRVLVENVVALFSSSSPSTNHKTLVVKAWAATKYNRDLHSPLLLPHYLLFILSYEVNYFPHHLHDQAASVCTDHASCQVLVLH